MGRDRPQPFNTNPDTGRRGYRMEWEAPDERPLVVYTEPFWTDDTERMTYEAAVESNPIRETDTLLDYLARVSATVVGKYKGVLPKIKRGMSRQDRERQLQKLRGQIGSKTEVL
jgi:hypothetical protein